ncbi:MAG: hypothetical protein NTZ05_07700 [Chloroflexi bacterium]|nr:hypothetical protein [Chloroflexota bacterium]
MLETYMIAVVLILAGLAMTRLSLDIFLEARRANIRQNSQNHH